MKFYFDATGYCFEADIIEEMGKFAVKEWGTKSFRFSTFSEDRYMGVDCYVLGVPVDVTLAYENKRRMKRLVYTLSYDGIEISFGVRYGNGRTVFEQPVLVIGVSNALGVKNSNLRYIIDNVKDNFREILNSGMDLYFETVDELE